jgi:hypothetical protein
MTKLMMALCACLYAVALVVTANPAHAAASLYYSYVSNTGSDSNDCSTPATACGTFMGALAKTLSGGEVDCVNPDNYAPIFTISRSVTIDCAGGVGATLEGVTINGAGIVVRLRNLSINRQGDGGAGIEAENMAALYVENCVITNVNPTNQTGTPYMGINFAPSANSQLFVTNSSIGNNGNSGGVSGGIYIGPASGIQATVSITHSQIEGNIFGIIADGTQGGSIRGVIKNSVVSGNSQNGITVSSSGTSDVLIVEDTDASNNGNHGLVAGGSGAGMLVRSTSVFNNGGGLFTTNGGTLYSYGDNSVNGNNGNDGGFTGTVGQQ